MWWVSEELDLATWTEAQDKFGAGHMAFGGHPDMALFIRHDRASSPATLYATPGTPESAVRATGLTWSRGDAPPTEGTGLLVGQDDCHDRLRAGHAFDEPFAS